MNSGIKIIEVDNFPNFLTEIEKLFIDNKTLWFRGTESVGYTLAPSIYRNGFTPDFESNFQNKFKSRALPFFRNRPVENYWEWLFIMQHHGVPTRLLDWSNSALISLGFALLFRTESFQENDAGLWCLNPEKLNQATRVNLTPNDIIPDIVSNQNAQASYTLDAAAKAEYPIAITGPINNDRIAAQKGVFTLFPNTDVFNLEDKDKADEFLTLIKINKDSIDKLKSQLYYLGITESTIYPDLNNLALEIKREFIRK
jgi:hypothetical protein